MRQISIDEGNEGSLNPKIDHQPIPIAEKCGNDGANRCRGLTLLE